MDLCELDLYWMGSVHNFKAEQFLCSLLFGFFLIIFVVCFAHCIVQHRKVKCPGIRPRPVDYRDYMHTGRFYFILVQTRLFFLIRFEPMSKWVFIKMLTDGYFPSLHL